MVNCTLSKLRHPKKCYVQDIGFFSVLVEHRIIQPCISKDLVYYYVLNLRNRVSQSILLSILLSALALELYYQFFLNFGIVLETCIKFCMVEQNFLEKSFLPQKLGKWTKNGSKTEFFEFIEKFGYYVLLNLFYSENLYHLLCSKTF